jgi:hypothetical protein
MDIGKAFSYVFEDPEWLKKVGIGGLVSIVPIVNFAAIGYMLTTMKNVADGQAQPLPEWSDFGGFFMKGLYAFVGILVYFLPAIVIYCCVAILTAVASGGVSSVNQNAGDAVGTVLALATTCLSCVVGLYSFVAGLTLYAPLTRFAMSNNQLNLFWDFRGNLDFVQKNLGGYFMALLVSWLAYIVGGFGIILCVVGVFFTYFWAGQVAAYLFGQFWKNRVASAAG